MHLSCDGRSELERRVAVISPNHSLDCLNTRRPHTPALQKSQQLRLNLCVKIFFCPLNRLLPLFAFVDPRHATSVDFGVSHSQYRHAFLCRTECWAKVLSHILP